MITGTDDGMLGVMNSSPCFYRLSSGFLPLCKAGSKEIHRRLLTNPMFIQQTRLFPFLSL